MGYLICETCKLIHEVQEDETPEKFRKTCAKCGSAIKYLKKLDEPYINYLSRDKILNILKNYPDYDENDLKYLFSHDNSKKIANSISKGDLSDLSPNDFEKIYKDYSFLENCVILLTKYGTENNDKSFTELGLKILRFIRKYLEKFTKKYAANLVNEGIILLRSVNGEKGSIDNLFDAIELFERARKEGLEKGTTNYGNSLANEAIALFELAENGVDPEDNYDNCINFFERFREEGQKGTEQYGIYNDEEAVIRDKLATKGIDPVNNYKKAVKNLRITSKIFKEMSLPYDGYLIQESYIRAKLAALGDDSVNNLTQSIEICREVRTIENINKSPNYKTAFKNELHSRSKLVDLNINTEENLNEMFILTEQYRNIFFESGTADYAQILYEQALMKEKLARDGFDSLNNYHVAIEFFEKSRKEGLKKGTESYITSLRKEGQLRTKLAENEIDPLNNLNITLSLSEEAIQGLKQGTEAYAFALMDCSITRQILANADGPNSLEHLNIALDLIEKARKRGLNKETEAYAGSLLEEGNIRGLIAIKGVKPVPNLNKSIDLFKKARQEFEIGSFPYALSLMNEGYNRMILSDYGVDALNNLQKSIELFDSAKSNGFKIGESYYGDNLTKKSFALYKLAELMIDPIKNLEESINTVKEARNTGLMEGTPEYFRSFMAEQMATIELAKYKDVGFNIDVLKRAIGIYNETRNSGFLKGTSDYGTSLLNEGQTRIRLSGLGINHMDELNIALDLFRRAKNEGLLIGTPEYAVCLMEEGNATILLAESEKLGPETFFKLNKALDLFGEAKETVDKNTYIYQGILVNEARLRLKLASINVNPLDNLKESLKLFNYVKKNPLNNISFKDEFEALNYANEAAVRLALVGKGISIEKNLDVAKRLLFHAENEFSKNTDSIHLIGIYKSLGNLMYLEEDFKKSYAYLDKAIKLIEDMRSSIKIPEFRTEYFENVIDAYSSMVFTCVALGKVKEAFRYSESSRGRNFLELLSNGKKEIKGDTKEIKEYKNVLNKIEDIEYQIFVISKKDVELSYEEMEKIDILKGIVHDLKIKHDKLLQKIKETDPEYYSLKSNTPVDPDHIEIIKNKTVIEYFIGKKLVIFVLNDEIQAVEIEINEKEIINKFIQFKEIIDRIEKNTGDFDILINKGEEILTFFYKLLIEPIKEHLKGELIIVPHKYLCHLPFQALKGDKYLIEEFKIVFTYSVSSLHFLNSKYGSGSLVVGNPNEDLNYSEEEAIQIAKIFDVTPLVKKEATKNKILNEIDGKENMHFACHGYYDSFNPKFSRINLSDGFLTTIDFMNLNINSKLIVLSACETALGPISEGNEVEGLVRSIHYAGCRSVLASLWKVDDKSTKELFLEFYNTEGNIINKIRNAELKLIKKYSFYHWAPFQLYGF